MPPALTEKSPARDPRVDPDDPVREPRQTLHLARDARRVGALPAVGEDHDHRPSGHPAAPVAIVELLQRAADPGSARPVRRGRGRALDRTVGVARGERTGHTGEPGREHERLGVGAGRRRAGEELQVGTGVRLHRARDVAEHHQTAGDDPAAAAGDRDRIAAGAQARPQRPPHVDAPPVAAALVAPRQPRRGRQLEPRHQPVETGELVGLERVEALRRQHLLVTRHRQRNVDLAPGLVVARPRRRRSRRRRSIPASPAARPAPPGASSSPAGSVVGPACGSSRPGAGRPPKTSAKTESNAAAWPRSWTNTERAVQ